MTTLEVKLNLPDGLAREAQAAGLLTAQALSFLLKEAVRRRSAQALLAGAVRSGRRPMSLKDIQTEVSAVRRVRGARKRA